jgi:hypothetical protein
MAQSNDSIDGQHDPAGRGSSSFMRLFGQMVMLPFTVFIQSMDLFIKTIREMQSVTDDGMNVMVGGISQTRTGVQTGERQSQDRESQTIGFAQRNLSSTANETTTLQPDSISEETVQTNQKEMRNMSDTNLSDDMLKLVRYKILFVKRDYEVAFDETEELVSDNTTPTAYTAWKVAEFIQNLGSNNVPDKWGGGADRQKKPKYPDKARYDDRNGVWVIDRLPEDDKKYLRVYFEVLDRYPREKFKYEERHIEILEDIRDKMPSTSAAPTTKG